MSGSAAVHAQVRADLERLGIPYEVIPCDPAFADTAQFCEKYGYPPQISGNTILVASRKEPKQFAACLVSATTRLDVNNTVRKLLGVRKLSFASAEDTQELTGMMIGGVTLFGLPEALPKYVDARIMDLESVIIGSGSRSSKIRMAPDDLLKIAQARVVEGLALDP
ncbi:MAG: YbaK/EbsC family protein [Dehalococcoidia bacterium]